MGKGTRWICHHPHINMLSFREWTTGMKLWSYSDDAYAELWRGYSNYVQMLARSTQENVPSNI